jgi:hypothetical protein
VLRGFTEVPGFIPFEVRHDRPEVKKQPTTEEGKCRQSYEAIR